MYVEEAAGGARVGTKTNYEVALCRLRTCVHGGQHERSQASGSVLFEEEVATAEGGEISYDPWGTKIMT